MKRLFEPFAWLMAAALLTGRPEIVGILAALEMLLLFLALVIEKF